MGHPKPYIPHKGGGVAYVHLGGGGLLASRLASLSAMPLPRNHECARIF